MSIRAVLNSAASSGSLGAFVTGLGRRPGEQVHRVRETPGQRQRLAERLCDLTTPRPVRGASERVAEVYSRGDRCLHGFELTKAEQNLGPLGGWRWLGQHPLQAERGDVGGAAAAGIGCGVAQLVRHPSVPGRGGRQQVDGHILLRATLGVEQPRGPQVPALPNR